MTNPHRNEITITLNNNTYLTRPTFNFIADVEDFFNLPLVTIVLEKLNTGKVRVIEIAAIIAAGVKATGVTPDIDQIKNDIAEAGSVNAINEIIPLLMNAFSGGDNLKKN